ncbi:MAG: SPOR domain-containing protein [Gammaproteobacteria bacterium]|nr:SPOR domain-containing protein [Gammaproteobacteria bacterium]
MERQRKERLVGAAVLVMLAVIFIPMVLDDSVQPETGINGTNIPAKPESEFESRVIPLAPSGAPLSGVPAEPAAPQTSETGPESSVVEQATRPDVSPKPAAPVRDTGAAPPAETARQGPAAELRPRPAPAERTPPTGKNEASPPGASAWVVQLGSFSSAENAESLNRRLRQAGYAAFVEPLQQDDTRIFRVRVGPELRRTSAQAVRDRLQANMDLDGIVVPYP